MDSFLQPLASLFSPDVAVPRAVSGRRWALPVLLLMGAVVFAGVGFALRFDAAPSVLKQLAESGPALPPEADIAQAVERAGRVQLLGALATGIFGVPFAVVVLAAFTSFVGWLTGLRIPFRGALSALSVALLPFALFQLILGGCELWQRSLTPERMATLVPSHLGAILHPHSPGLFRVLSLVDLFRLWCVGLFGVGLASLAQISRGRAVAFALSLYLAYGAVFLVGLPGLTGGVS